MLCKGADTDVADRRALDHCTAYGRNLYDVPRDRILLFAPIAQNAQDDLCARLAANAQRDLLAAQFARRHTVHGDDLIARAQPCRLAGRPLEYGDDFDDIVLEAHRHADAAERALRMRAQFPEHRWGHIDGVRITQGRNHAVDCAIDERRRIGWIHIARLNELHHAEEAQDIVRIESRRAQERARRKYGQHAPEQCGQDDDAA